MLFVCFVVYPLFALPRNIGEEDNSDARERLMGAESRLTITKRPPDDPRLFDLRSWGELSRRHTEGIGSEQKSSMTSDQ